MSSCYRAGLRWALVLAMLALRPAAAGLEDALKVQEAISEVAERVKPSVVSITSQRAAPQVPIPLPGGRGPQFGEARGSGMLFRETDDAYYILTNAHVVRGARDGKVKVHLVAERSERAGTVVGTPDRRTDTAVVRIDRRPGEHLPLVTFGSVKDLRVGAFVLAVGSPFDFEASVTFGVVSSLNRELEEPVESRTGQTTEVYRGLIQTDAPINPGNSGGPLVNLKGEVVGINFAIFSPGTAGSVGIGFAIPIDRALPVVEDLLRHGYAVRGYLGVYILDLDTAAKELKVDFDQLKELLGTDTGVYVDRVSPDSPAEKAGLKPGDVVISVDGQPVATSGEMQDRISAVGPGQETELELLRDAQRMVVRVTVGEMPVERTTTAPAAEPTPKRADPLGIKVEPVSPEKAQELGVEPRGLLITEAQPEGLGLARGLIPGTILLSGRRPGQERVEFKTVGDYETFIQQAAEAGETVQLTISQPLGEDPRQRSERSRLIRIPPPDGGAE